MKRNAPLILWHGAAEGRLRTAEYLLTKGVSPSLADRWNARPIDDAKRHQHGDIEKMLSEKAPKRSAAA